MSCFAVSKLTGKCGGGCSPTSSNSKKTTTTTTDSDEYEGNLVKSSARCNGSNFGQNQPKKKSKNYCLSNIEIVQEVISSSPIPPPSPRRCCPGSAGQPTTPQLQSRRFDASSICSPSSPHLGFHFNNGTNVNGHHQHYNHQQQQQQLGTPTHG